MKLYATCVVLAAVVCFGRGATLMCGKRANSTSQRASPRIAGGTTTTIKTWPWTAVVGRKLGITLWEFRSAGSILSERWILTATSQISSTDKLEVYVGSHLWKDSVGQTIPVTALYKHPKYKSFATGYDVALLKLSRDIMFNDTVRPICLPPGPLYEVPRETTCYFVGWGRTFLSNAIQDQLKQVQLTVRSKSYCETAYKTFRGALSAMPNNLMCADDGVSDTCSGDWGGPLMCDVGDGTWYQYGVRSFADTSCMRGKSFFVRVADVYAWIQNVTSLDFGAPPASTCKQPVAHSLTATPDYYVYNVGENATFACKTGYILNGTATSTCTSTGNTTTWQPAPPFCSIVTCESLLAPEHGSKSTSNTTYLTKVKFYCDTGYLLSGSASTICLSTGKWSHRIPRCLGYLTPNICGKRASSTTPRVYGGTTANIRDWPWIAMVLKDQSGSRIMVGGGSVLSERWVLTAASIFATTDSLVVYVGRENVLLTSSRSQQHTVREKYVHPKFRNYVSGYDFALLWLATRIAYNDDVRPICVPPGTDYNIAPEKTCYFAGWGRRNNLTSNLENRLRQVGITTKSRSYCQIGYRKFKGSSYTMPSTIMCAYDNRDDTCSGDWGGPLMCDVGNNTWYQYGVSSFSDATCGHGESFFGKITEVYNWAEWVSSVDFKAPPDVNECNATKDPCPNRKCTNYVGGYTCSTASQLQVPIVVHLVFVLSFLILMDS